ncbi:prepilin-type N-terminal cleavage/methylation domain-containing protein [bacterium]|nr:MAG: prepilin-type N-terminal cleavage/methylation domain-containing protein [bacterium]
MSKRLAFTLIELLVVIVIIAILAAILFPVFAQAKMAAKKTHSLGNVKQLGTAAMLYANDYEDWTMRANAVPGNRYPDRLLGYIKTWEIFLSPVKTNDPIGARSPSNAFLYDYAMRVWPEYGYNNRFLAENPVCPKPGSPAPLCTDAGRGGGHSLSEVTEHAATLQFVSSTFGYPGPDAPNVPMLGSWRVDPPAWWRPNDGPLPNNPSYYGMNWPRYNGMFMVSYVDGHAKALKVGQLSDETIWDLD